MEPITAAEYVLETLKDDLSKMPDLRSKLDGLVTSPDLGNQDENFIRACALSKTNGAIGSTFLSMNPNCYTEDLDKNAFLELYWCPNPSATDAIDLMTTGSRQLKHILKFLKAGKIESEKVKQYVAEFFKDKNLSADDGTRRVFLFAKGGKRFIIDGNHRAGSILRALSKDDAEEKTFPPLKVFCAILG